MKKFLAAVTLGALLLVAVPASAVVNWQYKYGTDFSVDPGWLVDNNSGAGFQCFYRQPEFGGDFFLSLYYDWA